MAQIAERVRLLSEELSVQAGQDPAADRYKTGVIAGYRDLLLIDFEEETLHHD